MYLTRRQTISHPFKLISRLEVISLKYLLFSYSVYLPIAIPLSTIVMKNEPNTYNIGKFLLIYLGAQIGILCYFI